ncbi:calpain-9-like isoform X1 [Ostrea edulis]|uniref:calpain-9-like isoform X1 n=1 Tax=Ostrea edulis TaxID=37623 RepID=UPI0024AF2407|nr:calpain-9-like isoform X1 [Ostrea edulis]
MALHAGNTRSSRGAPNMDATSGPGYANTSTLIQNSANDPPYALPHQYHNGVSLEKFHNMGVSSRSHVREADSHSRHHRGKSNFDNIRSECLQRGRLYEDPEFLAHETSVYYSRSSSFKIEWKRPSEIAGLYRLKPAFFLDNATKFDVIQGDLGDCWVVSAIACLTSPDHRELFRRVVPADQGFQDGWYAGIFRFNFWHFGKWVEVVVDDRLPTYRGQLMFVHSWYKNEFWAALMEKAYAKLYGSYEALKGGNVADALTDFTGGICEGYTLRGVNSNVPRNIVNILFKALDRQSLIGCGINPVKGNQGEQKLTNGLVAGHAYSVTDLREILLMSDNREMPITLIRVRNPWGNKVEWKGSWGDRSREWNSIPADDREKMGLVFRDDGEFWMEFSDFMRNFDSLEICNLTPDSPVEMPKQWHTSDYHGRWQGGLNAGGRPKYRDSHWTNPHFKVSLSACDEDGDRMCSFIVQLMQKDRRKIKHKGEKLIYIGFLVYRLSDDHALPLRKDFFETNQSVESSGHFINMRQRIARLSLPPGDYIVVPCTWDPNEEAAFYLRFFFENRNTVEETDEAPSREEIALPPTEKDKEEHFKRFFHSVSGEDMEVSPYELQTALNDALRKEPLHQNLSTDACKTFVSLLDVDGSGKLGFTEFLYLWNLLRSWKKLFYQYDVDGSGMLNSFELRRVLGAAGFKVDNSTMKSLVWRYADEKFQISLDNYFICLCRLMKLFNDFNKFKKNDEVTFSLSQVSFHILWSHV